MKKIEFAFDGKVQRFQAEVDELILAIATYMIEPGEDIADWASSVFVSDESCIGDFLTYERDVENLRKRLNIPTLQRRDFVCEVAETLYQMRNPN
jgi:hypothetical protein